MPLPPSSAAGHAPPSRPVHVLVDHRSALVTAGTVQMLSRAPGLVVRAGRHPLAARGAADGPAAQVLITDPARGLASARPAAGPPIIVLADDPAGVAQGSIGGTGVRAWVDLMVDRDELVDTIHRVAAGCPAGCSGDPGCARRALTPREADVLDLLTLGHCDKRIASALDLALPTVKTHVRSILAKLQVGSRTAAAVAALTGHA